MIAREFTDRLNRAIRNSDLLVRMGDEEFLVLLPDCTTGRVPVVLSRLRGLDIVFQGIIEHEVDFIQKPFTLDALSHKIRQVLDAEDKKAN